MPDSLRSATGSRTGTTPETVCYGSEFLRFPLDCLYCTCTTQNPSASSLSDGAATFLFFEDFEDHTAGDIADGWLPAGTYQVVDDGGFEVLDDGAAGGQDVIADHSAYSDVAVRLRFRLADGSINEIVVRLTEFVFDILVTNV